MNGLALPAGTRWALAGQGEEQQTRSASWASGSASSIVLMYMVLTILYESWLQPVLILTALPLATVGAFLGLLVFGQTLSVPAFIGLIALFGLVGKNASCWWTAPTTCAGRGWTGRRRWSRPAPHRLRPILMTSAVLILSMLPVALKLGDGGEIRAPLGAVLVGGMATSTFLSLLYVPVAYTYFDSFGVLMGKMFSFKLRLPFRRRATATPTAPGSGQPTSGGTGQPTPRPWSLAGSMPLPLAAEASLAAERVQSARGLGRAQQRRTGRRSGGPLPGRELRAHQHLTIRRDLTNVTEIVVQKAVMSAPSLVLAASALPGGPGRCW